MRLPSGLVTIIAKILRGKASSTEIGKFNAWYDTGLDSEWHVQDHKKRDREQVAAEMLSNIQEATFPNVKQSPPKQHLISKSFSVAASIALFISIGALLLGTNSSSTSEAIETNFLTFENTQGMIKKVRLPDGSVVSLFHNTKIQVAENFSENRFVQLSGEAFFEVKRDTLRPFRVASAHLTTEVLGTSFLIKNVADQQQIVAVKTGLVKVSDAVDSIFMLSPNLRLDYTNEAGSISGIPEDDPLFAWTEDVIVFENTPMSEMIKTLEDWYGVYISHDLTDSNTCQISGTYEKQSLENLLQLIQYSIPIHYQIDAKNVTLTFKNCH